VPAPPPPVDPVAAPPLLTIEPELDAALLEVLDEEREPTMPPTTAPAMMSRRMGMPIQSHFLLLLLACARPDPRAGLEPGG